MSTSFNNIKFENKNCNDENDNNVQELMNEVFNFDLLNEPLPDFDNGNDNYFLKLNKYSFKRKYNEINNNSGNNISPFIGKLLLKTK